MRGTSVKVLTVDIDICTNTVQAICFGGKFYLQFEGSSGFHWENETCPKVRLN